MSEQKSTFNCLDCASFNCDHRQKEFPTSCLTLATPEDELNAVKELYCGDSEDSVIARSAAEIEGVYYGKLTRVEEIIAFAKRIGAKKIGIASCLGLVNEAKLFGKVVKAKGLDCYGVICKVGSKDKSEIGIADEAKVKKGKSFEPMCNPVLQAKILEKEKTDLNVIIGLCVGHDTLFFKHSHAPVTVLFTKDRLLGHNAAVALYTSAFYYRRLLQEGDI